MGGIFLDSTRRSLVLVLSLFSSYKCDKIGVFVYNSGRRIELVDFSIYFSSMLVTSWIFFEKLVPKAGVHLKPVFPPLNLGLMRISRLRFKQSRNSMFISKSDDKRCFVNFLVIFGDVWKEIVFLKGLVKFGEIRNVKDLM